MALLDSLEQSLKVHQKLQVTVWDPDDAEFEFHFDSYIMDAESLSFKMAPPPANAVRVVRLLRPGMVVGAILDAFPNPFIFYPVIRLYQPSPVPGYWLKIPANTQIETIQRRRYVRIPMNVTFTVDYWQQESEADGRWSTLEATTEDVSGGGLRFVSAHRFVRGEELVLKIIFSKELPLLLLDAKVVFSTENRVRLRPSDLYVTACQFINLDKNTESIIVRECFRRELELRR